MAAKHLSSGCPLGPLRQRAEQRPSGRLVPNSRGCSKRRWALHKPLGPARGPLYLGPRLRAPAQAQYYPGGGAGQLVAPAAMQYRQPNVQIFSNPSLGPCSSDPGHPHLAQSSSLRAAVIQWVQCVCSCARRSRFCCSCIRRLLRALQPLPPAPNAPPCRGTPPCATIQQGLITSLRRIQPSTHPHTLCSRCRQVWNASGNLLIEPPHSNSCQKAATSTSSYNSNSCHRHNKSGRMRRRLC
jgi:hypothetical protein